MSQQSAFVAFLSLRVPLLQSRKTWDDHQIRPTNPALPDNSCVIILSCSLMENNTFQVGSKKKGSLCVLHLFWPSSHGEQLLLGTEAANRLWDLLQWPSLLHHRSFAINYMPHWNSYNFPLTERSVLDQVCELISLWWLAGSWVCSRATPYAPWVKAGPAAPEIQLDLGLLAWTADSCWLAG